MKDAKPFLIPIAPGNDMNSQWVQLSDSCGQKSQIKVGDFQI